MTEQPPTDEPIDQDGLSEAEKVYGEFLIAQEKRRAGRKFDIKVNGVPIEIEVPLDGSEGANVVVEDADGRNIFGFVTNGETVKIGYWDEGNVWHAVLRLGPPAPPDNWRAM